VKGADKDGESISNLNDEWTHMLVIITRVKDRIHDVILLARRKT